MEHHNVFFRISVVLWVLTLVVFYVRFTAADADKAVKDRLADWYVAIAGSNWGGLIDFALRSTEQFLGYLFGTQIASLRFFLIAVPISFLVSFTLLERIAVVIQHSNFNSVFVALMFKIAIVNGAIDVVALLLTRLYLRKAVERARLRLWIDLPVIFMIAYIAIIAATNINIALTRATNGFGPQAFPMFLTSLSFPYFLIYGAFVHDPAVFGLIMFLPAAFSTFLLLSIYIGAVLVYFSRPVTQDRLARFVERLASVGALPFIFGILGLLSTLMDFFW